MFSSVSLSAPGRNRRHSERYRLTTASDYRHWYLTALRQPRSRVVAG